MRAKVFVAFGHALPRISHLSILSPERSVELCGRVESIGLRVRPSESIGSKTPLPISRPPPLSPWGPFLTILSAADPRSRMRWRLLRVRGLMSPCARSIRFRGVRADPHCSPIRRPWAAETREKRGYPEPELDPEPEPEYIGRGVSIRRISSSEMSMTSSASCATSRETLVRLRCGDEHPDAEILRCAHDLREVAVAGDEHHRLAHRPAGQPHHVESDQGVHALLLAIGPKRPVPVELGQQLLRRPGRGPSPSNRAPAGSAARAETAPPRYAPGAVADPG